MLRRTDHSLRARLHRKLHFFWRLPLWKKCVLVGGPILIVLIAGGVATTIYFATTLTSKERIMNRNNTGLTLLDRNGQEFYSFYNAHSQTQVKLDDVSLAAQQALIASEDKDFYKHSGFSPAGIANAVRQNLLPGGSGGGGSTITQQLVKNALLTQQRSVIRKYQEFVLAVEIERRYSKQEILEMYLNSAYFGEGAFGIEDAAHTYFGKSAKDLDIAQASLLIGLLPAPSAYSPVSGDGTKAERRQSYVLGRMQEDGYITPDQAAVADTQGLSYVPAEAQEQLKAPHFALMIREQLEAKYGEEKIARSGYVVTTTLNMEMQIKAQEAVAAQIVRLQYSDVSNGAAVVINPATGEILALVGSTDWNNTDFGKVNMATAARQPGSSFKPIVYATGIENRAITAATIMHDKLTDFGGYTPYNYNLAFSGDVTVRYALANSLNVPAVEALNEIGISRTIQTAKDMGLTTVTESAQTYGLSLALGSAQAKLLEMTSAYGVFANEGKYNQATGIAAIHDKYGKQIFKAAAQNQRVISEGTSYIMSQMLSDNSARAPTFGSSLTVSSSRPVAVKTGTTEDYRDAWTIGYTPSLAVGVWIGNNDNSPMSSVAGSSGAAPIWRTLMQQYLTNTPVQRFAQPRGVVTANVCRGQEAVAKSAGSNTFEEYFLSGSVFSKACNTAAKEQPKPAEETKKADSSQSTTPAQTTPTTDTSDSNNDNSTETDTDSTGTGTDTGNGSSNSGGTGTSNSSNNSGSGTTDPATPVTPNLQP